MPNSRSCVRQTHERDHLCSLTRFVSIHSHMGDELGIENIFKEYKNPENNFGKNIKIMIGRKTLVLRHNLMGTIIYKISKTNITLNTIDIEHNKT